MTVTLFGFLGLIAGWVASRLMRSNGLDLIGNLIVGSMWNGGYLYQLSPTDPLSANIMSEYHFNSPVDTYTDGNYLYVISDQIGLIVFELESLANQNDPALDNQSESLVLFPNFPDPFQHETTIRFQLFRHETVDLSIYDISGRLIKQLIKLVDNFVAG